MTASCALGVSSPSCRPCPFSSRQAAPICVPDAGQWPSRRVPQAPHAPGHSSSPAPVPTSGGPHTTRGVLQLGRPPARGRGRLPPPGPPISPREVQGRPLPLCPLHGEERSLLPPRTPCRKAGVSSAPVPSTPNPQGTSAPRVSAAGGRGRSSLALGGGWETSALTPGPAGRGAPPRSLGSLSPLYPVTGAGGRQPSSVQRPAQLLLWGWPGSLSWDPLLCCEGWEALSVPPTPGLSLTGSLGVPMPVPSLRSLQQAWSSGPARASGPHACVRVGQGASWVCF